MLDSEGHQQDHRHAVLPRHMMLQLVSWRNSLRLKMAMDCVCLLKNLYECTVTHFMIIIYMQRSQSENQPDNEGQSNVLHSETQSQSEEQVVIETPSFQ